MTLQWRHNGRHSVSNRPPHDCLPNRLFRRRSKKTSKLRVTGLCVGNSSVTGEFPAQMVSNAENISIWCRHHVQDYTGFVSYMWWCPMLTRNEMRTNVWCQIKFTCSQGSNTTDNILLIVFRLEVPFGQSIEKILFDTFLMDRCRDRHELQHHRKHMRLYPSWFTLSR